MGSSAETPVEDDAGKAGAPPLVRPGFEAHVLLSERDDGLAGLGLDTALVSVVTSVLCGNGACTKRAPAYHSHWRTASGGSTDATFQTIGSSFL
jgi:hypothetical protein